MIILWLIAFYGIMASSYLLFFSIGSLKRPLRNTTSNIPQKRFIIMIPAYKEDDAVLKSAAKAIQLNYPKDLFDVVVIADSLQKQTTDVIAQLGCKVVFMNLTPRSKANAINLAFVHLEGLQFDYCVVLDAGHYLSQDALIEFNVKFYEGALAIQCQYVTKNITNPLQNMEAISESINNSIFRRGHINLGLSAALSGSGMAVSYSLFKDAMLFINANIGFVKDLEYEILSHGVKIDYLESVEVFDEKVSSAAALKNQRTPWFRIQIIDIRKGIKSILRRPTLDVIDKWWQMLLPPSSLLIGVFIEMIALSAFVVGWAPLTLEFISITIVLGISWLIATPKKYYNKTVLKSLLNIPVSLILLTVSALSFPKAFKGFIHTSQQSHSTKPAQS